MFGANKGREREREGERWARWAYTSASRGPFLTHKSLRLVALSGAVICGLSLSLFPFAEAEADTAREEGKEIKRGNKRRVVVLGSGWGAVSLLNELKPRSNVEVVCISPTNYFLMTPLLPSATVGTVDTRSIMSPIRDLCSRKNVLYYEAAAESIDPSKQKVFCTAHTENQGPISFSMEYDDLVIAVGASNNTFGTPGVTENCYFLKSAEDSIAIRRAIIDRFEEASLPLISPDMKKKLLHFVIVGGGPTGVEFAAELSDMVRDDVLHVFSSISRDDVKITLIQSGDHILNTYAKKISEYAEESFKRQSIDILINKRVTAIEEGKAIILDDVTKRKEEVEYGFCLWATGIASHEVIKKLSTILGQSNTRALVTDQYLKVKGAKNVYAIGDCATVTMQSCIDKAEVLFKEFDADNNGKMNRDEFKAFISQSSSKYPQLEVMLKKTEHMFDKHDIDHDGSLSLDEFVCLLKEADKNLTSLPATAQVAAQQGSYLAKALFDPDHKEPFRYHHRGSLAYIGKEQAIAELPSITLMGYSTNFFWRCVYLGSHLSIRGQVSLCVDWFKAYFFGRDVGRF